jgi:hypothetical protein
MIEILAAFLPILSISCISTTFSMGSPHVAGFASLQCCLEPEKIDWYTVRYGEDIVITAVQKSSKDDSKVRKVKFQTLVSWSRVIVARMFPGRIWASQQHIDVFNFQHPI